jgi:hypothetical protein
MGTLQMVVCFTWRVMLEAMGITGIRAHERWSQGWLDFGNSHGGITQCKIHKNFIFFIFSCDTWKVFGRYSSSSIMRRKWIQGNFLCMCVFIDAR